MIVVAGEALIDLAPRGELLLPLPGGSSYNVAVGLGRLGVETHFVGPLSRDDFGRRLAARLRDDGVLLDLAPFTDAPTTLAVVHVDGEGRADYRFYLEATSIAALATYAPPALPASAPLHVSFGALTLETPGGIALADLVRENRSGRAVSLDPNVRPSAIADLRAYAALLGAMVAEVDLVKVSDEDLAALYPNEDPIDVARTWAASGPALVVVTRGAEGASALQAGGEPVEVAAEPVVVVDTVGAGDAFTSGLLAWLDRRDRFDRDGLAALTSDEVGAALEHASRVAAFTCARPGADPPRLDDLEGASDGRPK